MSDLDLISRVRQRTGLLTIAEISELLRVSEDTVRREISRGALPAMRFASVYRVDPKQLGDWLAAQRVTNAEAESANTKKRSTDAENQI